MFYEVFAQSVGTLSQHNTLEEAVKKAQDYNHPCAIFCSTDSSKVVRWVMPTNKG